MKKIFSFIVGLVAVSTLQAVNYKDAARITMSCSGGPETQQLDLIVDADQATPATEPNLASLYEVGQVNFYVAGNYSSYTANAISNLPVVIVTNRRDADYTFTFNVPISTDGLTLTDLRSEDGLKTINIADGESYPFSIEGETGYDPDNKSNLTIADRFVINYVAPAPACTTIRENMEVGHYYTICIPQDIVSFNGASFWSMSNRGEGVAYLVEEAAPLTAGQPYIIQAEAEELCVVYGNAVPASEAGTAGALVGTFELMEQEALNTAATDASSDIYLLYNNELWKVNDQSGNSLPANRAYVVYDNLIPENPAPAPGRRVRAIPMQGQVATGIETLNAADAPAKTIIDGKLYIIRDKHMFDATGRMVK